MSGLAEALTILALIPVLTTCLSTYKSTYRHLLFALNRQKYVDKLASSLLLHRQIVEESVVSVLRESGVREIVQWLDEHPRVMPHDLLRQKGVDDKVIKYIGPANWEAFRGALQECSYTIQDIAETVARLVPELAHTENQTQLMDIIKKNREKPHQTWHFGQKLRLLFTSHDFKRFTRKLENKTGLLNDLTRTVIENRRATIAGVLSERAAKLARSLMEIRKFAEDMHLVLEQGWKNSRCHVKHSANLFLEDRVGDAHKILEEYYEPKSPVSPILAFPMIIAPGYTQKHEQLWHKTNFEIYSHHHRDTDDSPTLSLPPIPRPSLSKRQRGFSFSSLQKFRTKSSKSTSKSKKDSGSLVLKDPYRVQKPKSKKRNSPKITLIENACEGIESTKKDRQKSLVLLKDVQMGLIPATKPKWSTDTKPVTESLEYVFNMQRVQLPVKQKVKLALQLASNLIQLPHNQWLRKENIYFMSRSVTIRPQDRVFEFDKPFVSLLFGDVNEQYYQLHEQIEVRDALLELGILLLEIWHGISLETRFNLMHGPEGYYDRLRWAIEWYDSMENPPLNFYDLAVKACIMRTVWNGARLDPSWDWDNLEFCEAFCEEIIRPLEKAYEQFR